LLIALSKEDIREQTKFGMKDYETEKKGFNIKMSSVTNEKLVNLLQILQFPVGNASLEELRIDIEFEPFSWKSRQEDDAVAMCEARDHLEKQLSKFGCKFGDGNFKLHDVHSKRTILNVNDTRFTLSGSTDFIITPYQTNITLGAALELCVVFELKTDLVLGKDGIKAFFNQATVELIAARYLSNQPSVLVVLSDLCTSTALFQIRYNAGEFAIKVYQEVSLSQMAAEVSKFLVNCCVPDEYFIPSQNVSDAPARDHGVIEFKRQKVQLGSSLALEQFQDMLMDSGQWSCGEKAQILANLFSSMDQPMPASVQCMMYI
jgi:hypothetical protein